MIVGCGSISSRSWGMPMTIPAQRPISSWTFVRQLTQINHFDADAGFGNATGN